VPTAMVREWWAKPTLLLRKEVWGLCMLSNRYAASGAMGFILFTALFIAGCGEAETAAPKKDLSEKEKQQIRELNEQRASEWASTKKK
jgi:hypothetical protein